MTSYIFGFRINIIPTFLSKTQFVTMIFNFWNSVRPGEAQSVWLSPLTMLSTLVLIRLRLVVLSRVVVLLWVEGGQGGGPFKYLPQSKLDGGLPNPNFSDKMGLKWFWKLGPSQYQKHDLPLPREASTQGVECLILKATPTWRIENPTLHFFWSLETMTSESRLKI